MVATVAAQVAAAVAGVAVQAVAAAGVVLVVAAADTHAEATAIQISSISTAVLLREQHGVN